MDTWLSRRWSPPHLQTLQFLLLRDQFIIPHVWGTGAGPVPAAQPPVPAPCSGLQGRRPHLPSTVDADCSSTQNGLSRQRRTHSAASRGRYLTTVPSSVATSGGMEDLPQSLHLPLARGGTSAESAPLPEVTLKCQHARWRPITGRTRRGEGRCRYGRPAPDVPDARQPQAHRQRAEASGRAGRGGGLGQAEPGGPAGGVGPRR